MIAIADEASAWGLVASPTDAKEAKPIVVVLLVGGGRVVKRVEHGAVEQVAVQKGARAPHVVGRGAVKAVEDVVERAVERADAAKQALGATTTRTACAVGAQLVLLLDQFPALAVDRALGRMEEHQLLLQRREQPRRHESAEPRLFVF